MGIFNRIFGRRENTGAFFPAGMPTAPAVDVAADGVNRQFEGAQTNRLNSAYWSKVSGNPINTDLDTELYTLRNRVRYEIQNNPFVEGVINTNVVDLVGERGPELQIVSENTGLADEIEKTWRDWWAMPDVNGQYSGVDMLRQWFRSEWSTGEYFAKIVKTRGQRLPKIQMIESQRIVQPSGAQRNTLMGIEFDRTGKPIAYHVATPGDARVFISQYTGHQTDRVLARDMIHFFEPSEIGQIRGYPLLAQSLQAIADLRAFDAEVLQAARMAALFSIGIYSDHPDIEPLPDNTSQNKAIEAGQYNKLPGGWKFQALNPTQPAPGS